MKVIFLRPYLLNIFLVFSLHSAYVSADDYFDPDSIEIKGNRNSSVDLSSFSTAGGQAEGLYLTEVYVNSNYVDDKNIKYTNRDGKLVPILTKKDLVSWGVVENATPELIKYSDKDTIYNINTFIPDGRISYDFTQQRLDISIPQEYIRKNAQGSVPSSEWNDGLNMFFVNYGISGSNSWHDNKSGRDSASYLNLRSGSNLGPWRLRNYTTYTDNNNMRNWESINTYLQRDIKALKSQLIMGESYTPSEVFDSFAFRGIHLYSDDNMQPESMRGFAPVVKGIAQSNAQVTIRQDGNIIWQSYVSPGPFSINDLYPTSASGNLQVSVREADGSIRQFSQPFSAVPIMLRDGRFKYSVIFGKYRSSGESARTPNFIQSTGIYGMPWNSTLYGGTLLSDNYQAGNLGIGKSLGDLGSVSLDGTFSSTDIREDKEQGGSFRFQYSKDVAVSGTTFTLAGYRYSTSGYFDFNEANGYYANNLLLRYNSTDSDDARDKERQAYSDWNYTHNKRSKAQININQMLGEYGSLFLSAYQQQYWGVSGKERSVNFGYNVSHNDINYYLNYSYSRTPYYNNNDQILSIAVQIPFDRFLPQSWLNLSGSSSNNKNSNTSVGLSGTALADNNLMYNIQQGYANQGAGENGNVSLDYKARSGEYQTGYNYTKNSHQVNYGAMGGILIHPYGITFSQPMGDTMALVKAPGADGVKVQNNTGVYTNKSGYAVVPYVSPYHRNRISLDTATLGEKIDILSDTKTVVPSLGALALAEYSTVPGEKMMITLTGNEIPLGASASVKNDSITSEGIVDDRQRVYLSGAPEQGIVYVKWNGGHCQAAYAIKPTRSPVLNITAACR
uniref:fimbria/pilus outer membrane usher protein n=1 Tax=Serratia proteamaculans TaxID=28151 RepID=UPI001F4BE7EE|nr:fimbria/pilus outer membrane usher protein [Serratia proteamaculans]